MVNELVMQTIPIRDSEYRALAQYIYDKCGIALGDNKQELVKTRLGKRLRVLGIKNYGDYYRYVSGSASEEELPFLINAVTTNFTSFYREKQHFDFLLKRVLPEIERHKRADARRRIRAWCAASSTGEEPYTIALTILEHFKDISQWDIKLLATDISTKVLGLAAEGSYSFDKVKAVSPILLDRYFERVGSGSETLFRAGPALRSLIVFRRLNLMNSFFPFKGPFDFIFCRNVMIYFDQETQRALVERLLAVLASGGYLLIGHSENLAPALRNKVEAIAPATYRKIG